MDASAYKHIKEKKHVYEKKILLMLKWKIKNYGYYVNLYTKKKSHYEPLKRLSIVRSPPPEY